MTARRPLPIPILIVTLTLLIAVFALYVAAPVAAQTRPEPAGQMTWAVHTREVSSASAPVRGDRRAW